MRAWVDASVALRAYSCPGAAQPIRFPLPWSTRRAGIVGFLEQPAAGRRVPPRYVTSHGGKGPRQRARLRAPCLARFRGGAVPARPRPATIAPSHTAAGAVSVPTLTTPGPGHSPPRPQPAPKHAPPTSVFASSGPPARPASAAGPRARGRATPHQRRAAPRP